MMEEELDKIPETIIASSVTYLYHIFGNILGLFDNQDLKGAALERMTYQIADHNLALSTSP
jgi:hypothetical protein